MSKVYDPHDRRQLQTEVKSKGLREEKRMKRVLERKKQEKERARILAVANEVGISYGMMVFYLEQAIKKQMSRKDFEW